MMTKFGKTILFGFFLALVSAPALSDQGPSKEESIGISMGAVIGAAAGGPVGAILGAALGAKFGDELHERDLQVQSLNVSLVSSKERIVKLQRNIVALRNDLESKGRELNDLQELARPELLALLEAGIEIDLLFRTDEDVLSDSTGSRLTKLANSLVNNPDIQIRLDGYADERGDATYNQELSIRRATHVRDELVLAGVPSARIHVNGHGESTATQPTADSYALERRVSMTLYVNILPSFAANPR